ERAGERPQVRTGPVGPGQALQKALGDSADVVATVWCGDDFVNERESAAVTTLVELIRPHAPDLLVAGPAFNSGRYGLACGRLCASVAEALGIAVVTGMHPDNPGVEVHRQKVHIVPAGAPRSRWPRRCSEWPHSVSSSRAESASGLLERRVTSRA